MPSRHSLAAVPLFLLLFSALLTLAFLLAVSLFAEPLWLLRYIPDVLESASLSLTIGFGGALLLDLEILRKKWK